MPRSGVIDHIGLVVPDLVAARQYYDELMSILGLREWFATRPDGPLNYGPDGQLGSQAFLYQAEEPGSGEHCFATYWLDPHGFKLEAVCHTPEAAA